MDGSGFHSSVCVCTVSSCFPMDCSQIITNVQRSCRSSLPLLRQMLPTRDPRREELVVSQVLLILIGSGMTYCQGEGDCHGPTGMGAEGTQGQRTEVCVCIVDVCVFVRKQTKSETNLYQRRISKYEVYGYFYYNQKKNNDFL